MSYIFLQFYFGFALTNQQFSYSNKYCGIYNFVLSSSDIKSQIPVIGELSKKILSRQSRVAQVLNQLFLLRKKTTIVDYEPSEASTAVDYDDHVLNDLEESKDNMSKNSQADINSGPGNTKENVKGKKNHSEKSEGKGVRSENTLMKILSGFW